MTFKSLFILICILFCINAFAQTIDSKHVFPDSWLGNYQGKMYIVSAANGILDSLNVEFEFFESGIKNRWKYRMTYHSAKQGEIVKDYELIKPDSLAKNTYLIDEKDGILIQNTLIGNTLYSNFIVSGSLLCSILRKENNDLFFEIFTSKDQYTLSTQSVATGTEDSFIVDSCPPYTTQFVHFRKIFTDSQSDNGF